MAKQCKGKDCKNEIPDNDRHRYCVSCRNKRAKLVKDGFVGAGKAVAVVGTAAVAFVKSGAAKEIAEMAIDAVKSKVQL